MFVLAATAVAEMKAKIAVRIVLFMSLITLIRFRLQRYDDFSAIVASSRGQVEISKIQEKSNYLIFIILGRF